VGCRLVAGLRAQYGAGRICCISAMSRSFWDAPDCGGAARCSSPARAVASLARRILSIDVGWHPADRAISDWRDDYSVGHALPALGPATLQLSHRLPLAMLWTMRKVDTTGARSRAGGLAAALFVIARFLPQGIEFELRVSRPVFHARGALLLCILP